MGWDGSGTFTRSYDWTNERDANYKIDATKFDTENDNFATGINACLAKNGENAATADLPMGGHIHTGAGEGTALTHYARVEEVQNGQYCWGGTSGGSANAQTVTLDPAPTAIGLGRIITFIAGFTNTAACTLNPNGIGADHIQRHGSNLVGGEIVAGRGYTVVADGGIGVFWNLINDVQMGCQVVRAASQAVANATTAEIFFDAKQYDPDSMVGVLATPDILLPIHGLWLVTVHIQISTSSFSTLSRLWIEDDLANQWGLKYFGENGELTTQISTIIPTIGITTNISVKYFNNSGSSQNIIGRVSATFIR